MLFDQALVQKDHVVGDFAGKADFVGDDDHGAPLLGQHLHDAQHFALAVAAAPTTLMAVDPTNLGRHPLRLASRHQCTTIPDWLSVNDTNTPRM